MAVGGQIRSFVLGIPVPGCYKKFAKPSVQDIIQQATDSVMLNYVQIASLALLSYDTLVTLSSEVTYIWPQKLRLGTVFYLLSRYAALLVLIFSVIVNLSSLVTSLNVCNIMFRIPGGLNLLAVTGEQGLLLARAYAISKRNKVVLWALGLVYISTLGLTVFISVKNSCTITDQELNVILKAQTAKNILFILFDTSVVAITLGIIRLPIKSQVFGEQTTSQTLVNQGGIRYGFVLTIALTNTIVTKTVNPRISTILSSVQDSLSAIIIYRCHLALQERSVHPSGSTALSTNIGGFPAARQWISNVLSEEFGDRSVDETSDTDISDGIKLQKRLPSIARDWH